ncbi:uncharacterized mitochondrial protein AtMg00860-like [Lycium ferocissimum]|uniref:uncharacterized mitochondrial protein AtMg00860-like n=1 Tax=Lycium ferocissimum TaxID=112874 RepID=UPI00281574EC|nr:uncharacterized mitochondrial protein AtMg00860-like [Lycium ferocissimum]
MDISRIQAYTQNLQEGQQQQKSEREHDRYYSKRARSLGPARCQKVLKDRSKIRVSPADGIRVDTHKIEAMKTWPKTTTPTVVRSFLGLVGYYKRFVEEFSSISVPLTKLTQKSAKFQWTDACKHSFQKLKDRLTLAPVLTLPERTEGYMVSVMLVDGVRSCVDATW